ncbi:membrane cofactor protein-like [Myotis myotis]|uniref:membrane cofactor protein-like n=1 Tax=Myotis myotis TaxID=51298 RepID=UPI001749BB52|nr:membrane cofactor protein-like [Myotis myotis]
MSGNMRASYEPLRASSRRLESPFSWGFLGILVLALELLLPTCSGDCGETPKFKTMSTIVEYKPPVINQFEVEYVCNPGYKSIYPDEHIVTVCEPDGTYNPPLQEACTEVYCPQLRDLQNGEVIHNNGPFKLGSQVEYVCNEGYYTLGANIITCQISGTNDNVAWNDKPPTCVKVLCQPPPYKPHAEFNSSHKTAFEYNETIIYTCKPSGPDGYSLVGESKLVCSANNRWSSEPPECRENSPPTTVSPNRADDLGIILNIDNPPF